MHLLPPLRWRLVEVPFGLDYPYWVDDDDFDLTYHVRDSALPPPGTNHQLAELVSRLHSRQLDRTRPLWEMYVISGLRRRIRRGVHQDPPRAPRRGVGRRDHGIPAGCEPHAGRPLPPAEAAGPQGPPGTLQMLGPGFAGRPALSVAGVAVAAGGAAQPGGDDVIGGTGGESGRTIVGTTAAGGAPREPSGDPLTAAGAQDVVQPVGSRRAGGSRSAVSNSSGSRASRTRSA